MKLLPVVLFACVSALLPTASLKAWEGIAVHGAPKYKEGFTHLSYANPDAPKGGSIEVGWAGDFNTQNPFGNKGLPPLLLQNLVFQSLGQATLDEPFTQYPEVADNFELSADKLVLTVHLRQDAVFADGRPVTSADVKFSFDLFTSDKVDALYKTYWSDVKELQIIDSDSVKFVFKQQNSELAAITTQLTILPKHFYEKGDFARDFADSSLGSGPYMVGAFKRGSFITYKRNPRFWAANAPMNRGRFNFDEITVKYYKDPTAQVEGFKKGEFDIFFCNSSKVWANDLDGDRFSKYGWITKELWQHRNNQGSQGFYFNLRKPLFGDRRIRQAIALAFDFAWTNKTLFYGQYIESKSFFENSPYKAEGLPTPREAALLKNLQKRFPEDVPEDVLSAEMGGLGKGLSYRERLKLASQIFKDAGFTLKDGLLVGVDGKPLEFTFLLDSQTMARVVEPFIKNLRRIGVQVAMEVKEESVYQQKLQARDFDMIVLAVGQSQSPGNEQTDLWHSSSAQVSYSRNHAGLSNQGVDALVKEIIYAKSLDDLTHYTKVLDRLLYHLHIAVQNWHSSGHRVALWRKFARPAEFPLFYAAPTYLDLMWWDKDQAAKLKQSMLTRTAL